MIRVLKTQYLKDENVYVAGINCLEINLAIFATFSSHDKLFPDLLRHLITMTFNFFEKKILLFSLKRF